ncbi:MULTISPECIES: ACT domain-containing protein [unclassified Pseudovibrio]|uniref:ACT domain-containing protein n=1 Tax=unclassified Pseudovibrio TaxID=2627060 RepID=UPI0007AE6505|nr:MULTISPECIES: ACT domain-containing protein [unclassified Pseudovibrio]KZL00644.1 ACT domain protein [Pseudovibrio sp. W74]KZL06834.1 ACT domain protein [Pseudovibrio sp. Ad14]
MTSRGGLDLQELLASMEASLSEESFVFCCFPNGSVEGLAEHSPLGLFWENEGLTAILSIENAGKAGVDTEPCFRRISLAVHSSLEAVGLTAALSSALADVGISANVVAAYYHDHIFVPEEKAEEALAALTELSRSAKAALS